MNRVVTCAPPYHIPGGALAADRAPARTWNGVVSPPAFASAGLYERARQRERGKVSRGARSTLGRLSVPILIVAALAGSMMALAARERIVLRFPILGVAYAAIGLPTNSLGLAIEDVQARMSEIGSRRVLLVDGVIVNRNARDTGSPSLRIVLRGADGSQLYEWTTRAPKAKLGRSERVPFAARLEAPPDDVEDAVVSFVGAANAESRRAEGP